MITKKESGFSLLEIIITIVIAGMVGAFLIPLIGTNLQKSGEPIRIVAADSLAEQAMERVVSDYVIQTNGTSGSDAIATILSNINSGLYGSGVSGDYISFSAGSVETSANPTNHLRVRSSNGGHTLVMVLSKSRKSYGTKIKY